MSANQKTRERNPWTHEVWMVRVAGAPWVNYHRKRYGYAIRLELRVFSTIAAVLGVLLLWWGSWVVAGALVVVVEVVTRSIWPISGGPFVPLARYDVDQHVLKDQCNLVWCVEPAADGQVYCEEHIQCGVVWCTKDRMPTGQMYCGEHEPPKRPGA